MEETNRNTNIEETENILEQEPVQDASADAVVEMVSKNLACPNCGAPIDGTEKFCETCGHRFDAPGVGFEGVQPLVAEPKKSKAWLWIVIAAAATTVVAAVIFVIIALMPNFNGTYEYIGGEGDYVYTFKDGEYTYDNGDEEINGEYELNDETGEIKFLSPDSRTGYEFAVEGDIVYNKKACFEDEFNPDTTSKQELSKITSFTNSGKSYALGNFLTLNDDGTFVYAVVLASGTSSDDMNVLTNEEGTYTVEDNLIILDPDDESYTRTYLVVDNIVYYDTYKKQ